MDQVFVYAIGDGRGKIKVGFSKQPERRLNTLQITTVGELCLLCLWPASDRRAARLIEKHSHYILRESHISREWFRADMEEVSAAVGEAMEAVERGVTIPDEALRFLLATRDASVGKRESRARPLCPVNMWQYRRRRRKEKIAMNVSSL